MGRIIFTIIHILFVSVGVVLVTSITDANTREAQVKSLSSEAYHEGDLSFMVDGNYVNDIPIIETLVTQNDRTFRVYVFDVAYATTMNEQTTFDDGLQFIIEQTDGPSMPYATAMTLSDGDEFEIDKAVIKYYDLPLYINYDQEEGTLRIERDMLGDHILTNLTVYDNEQTYLSLDISLSQADLVAKGWIDDYMATHDVLNVDDIDHLTTIRFLDINTLPNIIRNLSIYVIIASILSAVVIFYRKRHMGRGKVNPRLKADLERLNAQRDIKEN